MKTQIRSAALLVLVLTGLLGLVYPLAITGVAQVLFPSKANGSLIVRDRTVVGSALIGQAFSDPGHLWGRPSATSPMPYNAAASNASNLGPSNPALVEAVKARIAALRAADPGAAGPVPVDLVTASASGLDPDISPAAAEFQVHRIAKARGIPEQRVRAVVAAHTLPRQFGVLGEPRVNVLAVNLDLDRLGTVVR